MLREFFRQFGEDWFRENRRVFDQTEVADSATVAVEAPAGGVEGGAEGGDLDEDAIQKKDQLDAAIKKIEDNPWLSDDQKQIIETAKTQLAGLDTTKQEELARVTAQAEENLQPVLATFNIELNTILEPVKTEGAPEAAPEVSPGATTKVEVEKGDTVTKILREMFRGKGQEDVSALRDSVAKYYGIQTSTDKTGGNFVQDLFDSDKGNALNEDLIHPGNEVVVHPDGHISIEQGTGPAAPGETADPNVEEERTADADASDRTPETLSRTERLQQEWTSAFDEIKAGAQAINSEIQVSSKDHAINKNEKTVILELGGAKAKINIKFYKFGDESNYTTEAANFYTTPPNGIGMIHRAGENAPGEASINGATAADIVKVVSGELLARAEKKGYTPAEAAPAETPVTPAAEPVVAAEGEPVGGSIPDEVAGEPVPEAPPPAEESPAESGPAPTAPAEGAKPVDTTPEGTNELDRFLHRIQQTGFEKAAKTEFTEANLKGTPDITFTAPEPPKRPLHTCNISVTLEIRGSTYNISADGRAKSMENARTEAFREMYRKLKDKYGEALKSDKKETREDLHGDKAERVVREGFKDHPVLKNAYNLDLKFSEPQPVDPLATKLEERSTAEVSFTIRGKNYHFTVEGTGDETLKDARVAAAEAVLTKAAQQVATDAPTSYLSEKHMTKDRLASGFQPKTDAEVAKMTPDQQKAYAMDSIREAAKAPGRGYVEFVMVKDGKQVVSRLGDGVLTVGNSTQRLTFTAGSKKSPGETFYPEMRGFYVARAC